MVPDFLLSVKHTVLLCFELSASSYSVQTVGVKLSHITALVVFSLQLSQSGGLTTHRLSRYNLFR